MPVELGTLGTSQVSKSLVPDSTSEPPQPTNVTAPTSNSAARHAVVLVNIEFSQKRFCDGFTALSFIDLRISFFIVGMSSLGSIAFRNTEWFLFVPERRNSSW